MPEYVYYGGNKSGMYGEAFVGKLRLLKFNPNLESEIVDLIDPNKLVALYDLAAEEEEDGKVTAKKYRSNDNEEEMIFYPGFMYGGKRKGLACCAAIVAHEVHHVDLNNVNAGRVDADKDQMADDLEGSMDGVATHVGAKDTYHLSEKDSNYRIYAEYGDNEIRARRIERIEPRVYHEDKDWANPGFQSKDKCGYDPLKN